VTASFGVSQLLDDINTPQALVDLADQALMVAKQSGRNRVIGYQAMTDTIKFRPSSWGPGAIFGELPAKSVMTTIFSGLNQNKTLGDAAQYFLRLRINSAPVVDDEGKLVGVISEKDVMAMMLWPTWWKTEIHEVMRANVICYEEDTPVLKVYEFLCRVSIRSAMVVKDGRPTGIIGRGCLLRWFVNALRASTFYEAAQEPAVIESTQDQLTAQKIVRIISENVMKEGYELHEQTLENADDLLPMMVTAASRLQDLSNDLLSCSSEAAVHKATLPAGSETFDTTIEGIGHLLSNLQNLQTDTVRGH